MITEGMNYKDLTKGQLEALKDIYMDRRVKGMSDIELRKFVREVLELQVRGTVGNTEEREVWKEMKDYFEEDFENQINEVIKSNTLEEVSISPEQEEFQKRLKVLEQRKAEQSEKTEDMWDDD